MENTLEEIEMVSNIPIHSQKNAPHDSTLNYNNLTCFLIKINTKEKGRDLNRILQNLSQYKIKIIDLLISKDLGSKVTEKLELFNQNFPSNYFVKIIFF